MARSSGSVGIIAVEKANKTVFAKAARSIDVSFEVPMMRAAGFPWTRDAMRRAMDAGSLSNAATAHPKLSTNVRFTWCIASEERSS